MKLGIVAMIVSLGCKSETAAPSQPPADCQSIADHLASYELGNYAEPEERSPLVARHKAACERAHVTQAQGECVANAADQLAAQECAPGMFPEAKKAAQECDMVTVKIQAAMARNMVGVVQPDTQRTLTRAIDALRDSCKRDGWSAALKTCLLEAANTADAMTACQSHMSPELQQRMTDRIAKIMRQP